MGLPDMIVTERPDSIDIFDIVSINYQADADIPTIRVIVEGFSTISKAFCSRGAGNYLKLNFAPFHNVATNSTAPASK